MRRVLPIVAVVFTAIAAAAYAHFPGTATVQVPQGGAGFVQSPDIPAESTFRTIEDYQKERDAKDESTNVFLRTAVLLKGLPNKKTRLLTCGTIATHFFQDAAAEGEADAADLTVLFLKLCTTVARLLPEGQASPSAAGCAITQKTVGIKLTRQGKNWHAVITSNPAKISRPAVVASCSRAPGGVKIKVRPRSRRASLRKALGPHLAVGVVGHPTDPVTVKSTFTLRK